MPGTPLRMQECLKLTSGCRNAWNSPKDEGMPGTHLRMYST